MAHWKGSAVTRWDPNTGKQLRLVQLPVSKITSCCFGGKNLDKLYITTASYDCDLTKEPLAGSLFVLHNPGVKGTITQTFIYINSSKKVLLLFLSIHFLHISQEFEYQYKTEENISLFFFFVLQ